MIFPAEENRSGHTDASQKRSKEKSDKNTSIQVCRNNEVTSTFSWHSANHSHIFRHIISKNKKHAKRKHQIPITTFCFLYSSNLNIPISLLSGLLSRTSHYGSNSIRHLAKLSVSSLLIRTALPLLTSMEFLYSILQSSSGTELA